jgi:uncharacterized membrane protein
MKTVPNDVSTTTMQQFATRRARHLASLGILLVLFLGIAMLQDRRSDSVGLSENASTAAIVVLLLGGAAFSFWNWRCPACSRYLGRTFNPRFCPRCGVALR